MLPPCAVVSPMRAAGLPQIMTVAEPLTMLSGGPVQTHMSPMTAAGILPMSTVGAPGPVIGPPTCGMGGTAGVTIGQTCMSVIRAAGGIGDGIVRLENEEGLPLDGLLVPELHDAIVELGGCVIVAEAVVGAGAYL